MDLCRQRPSAYVYPTGFVPMPTEFDYGSEVVTAKVWRGPSTQGWLFLVHAPRPGPLESDF